MNEIINYLTTNLTLPFIFLLGMVHALEPGHGKTFILAYMSGGSMRIWGTVQLITALILTHFALFSLLAYLIKVGSDTFPIFLENDIIRKIKDIFPKNINLNNIDLKKTKNVKTINLIKIVKNL